MGAVGKDAAWPIDELKKRNVKVEGIQILDDLPTGRAFIQVSMSAERKDRGRKGWSKRSREVKRTTEKVGRSK